MTEALKSKPAALYIALYPTEGIAVTREWISLGGTRKMVVANSLKSDEYRDGVGAQYLTEVVGHDSAPPRTESAATFKALYVEKFGSEPNGPGLPNSFDAVMIALLAAPSLDGEAIAASIARVTDPSGTPIFPDAAGIARARALLDEGKTIRYQGGTGAVRFDQHGDVSAPAVAWTFTEQGVAEQSYYSLQDVDDFIASLSK